MNNIIKILLFLILLSCNFDNREEVNNRYEIISLLYDKLAQPIEAMYPPPPPNDQRNVFSSKDSTRLDSMIKKVNIEKVKKKFIVAVYPYLTPYKENSQKHFLDDTSEFNTIMNKLINIKDSIKISINKIKIKENDSIIYYNNQLSIDKRKDFYSFDILVSFSNISFNLDYTKAIVVGAINHSRIAGASIMFFLEKKKGQWVIKYEKGLTIS